VVGELEPAGQSVHAALPVAVLYLPAAHAVHGVVPVNPAAHGTRHVTLQEAPIPEPSTEESAVRDTDKVPVVEVKGPQQPLTLLDLQSCTLLVMVP
jgi:hypothetical protein